MFGNMKMLGALTGLMQNKEALKAAGERIQARAAAMRVVGEAGGGAVRATVDGKMRVTGVEIAPALAGSLSGDEGRRSLEGWIAQATNAAQTRAQDQLRELVRAEARELGLEDLFEQYGGDLGKLLQ